MSLQDVSNKKYHSPKSRAAWLLAAATLFGVTGAKANSVVFRYTVPPHQLIALPDGSSRIEMTGYGSVATPGLPNLPSTTLHFAMDVPCRVTGVEIRIVDESSIGGTHTIDPCPPLIGTTDQTGDDDRAFDVFQSNLAANAATDGWVPSNPASWEGTDMADRRPVVRVRVTPFRYNPVRRLLSLARTIEVRVEYASGDGGTSSPTPLEKRIEASETVHRPSKAAAAAGVRLLVIGSKALEPVIRPFLFWKRSLGDSVRFASMETVAAESEGMERAEALRRFLQARWAEGAVTDAIFVGHKDTIPLKRLYPDPANHGDSGAVPSDMYFAELTGDWDGDGDGFCGEFGEDHPDWIPEIRVGRIPYGDSTAVRAILERIMAFEASDEAWKRSPLLIGGITNYRYEKNKSFLTEKTDGAALMEALRTDVFDGAPAVTVYEKAGIDASVYDCAYGLDRAGVDAAWNRGAGCVTWWLHGRADAAVRKVWASDDGDGIPETEELSGEDLLSVNSPPGAGTHPSIVYANACENGWPEKTSLGRELIRSASAAVIAATRTTYYVTGWENPDDGGNASLAFAFWSAVAGRGESLGQSLAEAQWDYQNRFGSAWQHMQNVYATMLFGDPTLSLADRTPVAGTLAVSVTREPADWVPDGGVRIAVKGFAGEPADNGSGLRDFGWLPAGSYALEITGSGFQPFEQTVEVTAGKRNESVVVLRRAPVPVARTVLEDTTVTVTLQEGCASERGLVVRSTGTDTLRYRVFPEGASPEWLACDTSARAVAPAGSDSVRFRLDAALLNHGTYGTELRIRTNGEGTSEARVRVELAVIDTVPPAPIEDLVLIDQSADSAALAWSAPGDNRTEGSASRYEIYATDAPTSVPDPSAGLLLSSLEARSGGKRESVRVRIAASDGLGWIRIRTLDDIGLESFSNSVPLQKRSGAREAPAGPKRNELYPNYPNPFNRSTVLPFDLIAAAEVRVAVVDAAGRTVRELARRGFPAGHHALHWDSEDGAGRPVPSGIYLVRLQTPGFSAIRKIMIIR
jgi:hypothetical protein